MLHHRECGLIILPYSSLSRYVVDWLAPNLYGVLTHGDKLGDTGDSAEILYEIPATMVRVTARVLYLVMLHVIICYQAQSNMVIW